MVSSQSRQVGDAEDHDHERPPLLGPDKREREWPCQPMISKDNAEHYLWGNGCNGWHLVKRSDLSIIHERMPPGTAEVRHYHRAAWQFFFVLFGTATLEIAGEREVLQPQQGIEVPAGVAHQMRNESETDIEFIVISQPPGHGDRVLAEEEERG
jgi:mannose-6-phosphate isomerase-like protein (cupin superfamily)